MINTVDELLKNPFSERTLAEKIKILTSDKPRPVLSDFGQIKLEDEQIYGVDSRLYDKVKWLTACERKRKLFCWPCLLFMAPGKCNIEIEPTNIKNHGSLSEHIEAVFKCQIFIMENISKSNLEFDKIRHNEAVKRNREVLKLIIDAICFVTKNQLRGTNDYECAVPKLKVVDCVHFLRLLSNCNKLKIDVTDAAVALLNDRPKILNNLVDAITIVVKAKIANEAQDSTYVSLLVNEHVINSKKSQISTILRYITRDKVHERFIGFTPLVDCKWCHDSLENHILNVIKDYGISEKFLAFSVDGAVLPHSELPLFVQSIKSHFKLSYFIPPYTGFGYILLQSLSAIEECSLFMRMINSMECFFEDERVKLEFDKIRHVKNKKWYTSVPFIALVGMYRMYFVDIFDSVVKESKLWSADDIVKAEAFRRYLREQHTMFLLKIFNGIFSDNFDRNFNFIESPEESFLGTPFNDKNIEKFLRGIMKLKENGLIENDHTTKNAYESLFHKIIDHVIEEINIRCEDLKSLDFCDMMTCNHLGMPNFSYNLRLKMQSVVHGLDFDDAELNSEITVFKGNRALFSNKSVHELLEELVKYNLKNVFTQLYKLTALILTLPFLPASETQKISKLENIRDFSYIPQHAGIPSGDVSVLCLENEMLQDLKCAENFYDDVLAKFSEVAKEWRKDLEQV